MRLRWRAFQVGVVAHVPHGVAAPGSWREAAHLAQGADLGPLMHRFREVVVVERVLGAVVAADVALAAETTGGPRHAMQVGSTRRVGDDLADRRRPPRSREGHGQRRQEGLPAQARGRVHEGHRAGRAGVRLVVEGEPLRRQHPLGAVVVGVQVLARDRPVLGAPRRSLLVDEPLGVLAQHHIGVDERSTAEPGRDDRAKVVEGPDREHPVEALARIPECPLEAVGAAREAAGRIGLAAFQEQDAKTSLRQAVGAHRAAEPGTDHDGVEVGVGGRGGAHRARTGAVVVAPNGAAPGSSWAALRWRTRYRPRGTSGRAAAPPPNETASA